MKRIGSFLLGLLLLAQVASGAASFTATAPMAGTTGTAKYLPVHKIILVSAANGTVSGTFTMNGRISYAVTVPGAAALEPSADWDCTLTDPRGADISGTSLTDRSATVTTATQMLTGTTPWFPRVDGTFTLACSGMGDSNGATVYFIMSE